MASTEGCDGKLRLVSSFEGKEAALVEHFSSAGMEVAV